MMKRVRPSAANVRGWLGTRQHSRSDWPQARMRSQACAMNSSSAAGPNDRRTADAVCHAGRPIASQTVAQYRLGKYVIPEVEDNATFYEGGANDGKTQNFIAPGIMFGKLKVQPHDAKARSGFSFGVAEQIATSKFHTYNHGLYFTGRLLF